MKEKSLKLNFIMNALLTMSSFLFPLITFPYVSRILMPVGMGKVNFATSLISYFTMFANLGIPTYGIRVCAQVRDNKEELTRVSQELLIISLITTFISYIALILALFTVKRLQDDRLLYVIISSTILLTTIGMEWLYKALEQYTYITVRSLIFKFIALIGMFLLVHRQSDYVIYGGVSILAASASNVLNLLNAHKYISFRPIGNYNFKRHLKPIFVFFAMSCATTIYTNLDNVMLGFMKDDAEVGYYNAAVKIKQVLVSLVTSLGTVLLPRISYYIELGKMKEFRSIIRKTFNFVMLVSIPLMIYFMIYAKEGIYFLSGKDYTNSILPMQIIMPTLLFIGLSNIIGIQILVPMGRENIVLYSEIAGAVVDLIINFTLIPSLGASGAAIGTVVAEAVVLLYQYCYMRNDVRDCVLAISYWKIMLGTGAGIAASSWIRELRTGSFLTLLLSAVLFFGAYGVILLVTKEKLSIELINQILQKLNRHKNIEK